ncbi:hypothetical protein [Sediminitomix flava]|uniref:Uncharacterized protein n=1 Tax=Sediminitomix flava TaxID=379075 RepID=A0A315ZJZ8_SEDFL|nr:hypothetical protein [Sediminitomix flava]PWJ45014.1 hypothetical protein BC781_1011412 [Sediminitomix flava]
MNQHKTSQAKSPSYWKQVLVTIFTVYPLILIADWILTLFLPMRSFPPQFSVFLTVVVVASLMVYPVMPWVKRLLGNWMES